MTTDKSGESRYFFRCRALRWQWTVARFRSVEDVYGKTVERGRFLIDVSPKCRVPHLHRPFSLPIAQIHMKTANKHNAAEHCARHDHKQNPIACCSGRPKYRRPRRGSKYGNSDYESHRGKCFLCFIKEHDSWTCDHRQICSWSVKCCLLSADYFRLTTKSGRWTMAACKNFAPSASIF